MSSDQEYKDQRERDERQRVRERIRKELDAAASRRTFMVEIQVDPRDADTVKAAECRLRCVSGVLAVQVL